MMTQPKPWAFGLVVLVVLGAGVWWWTHQPDTGSRPSVSTQPQDQQIGLSPGTYQWPTGTVLLYQAKADWDTEVEVGAEPNRARLTGALSTDLQLRLTALQQTNDLTTFSLDIPRLDKLQWKVLGKELPAQETTSMLTRATVLVQMDNTGVLRKVTFAANTPQPVARLVETLSRQFQGVIAPKQPSWRRSYDDGFVDGAAHHTLEGCQNQGCTVTVTRQADAKEVSSFSYLPEAYQWQRATVDTDHRFEVNQDHVLQAFTANTKTTLWKKGQTLPVASSGFQGTLRLLHLQKIDPSQVAARLKRIQNYVEAHQLKGSARPDHKERIAGMTLEQAQRDLLAFGEGGGIPDLSKWMWRVTGLLMQDPTLSAAFAQTFFAPGMTQQAQALVLEILGSTGHTQAQAAMRDVLGSDETQAHPKYAAMVQRFVLVQNPEPESLTFLSDTWQATQGPARYGAATALGASIARTSHKDPASAQRYTAQMVQGLEKAGNEQETRALLGALANTRMPEAEEPIRGYANHNSTGVRTEVARALSQHKGQGATQTLVQLSADPDQGVQRAAVRALHDHKPAPAQLEALTTSMRDGTFNTSGADALVLTCQAWHKAGIPSDALRPLVQTMSTLPSLERRTQHKIAALLRALDTSKKP